MHISVIAQVFPPDMGGGSTRAYNAVKGLISLRHRVTVVTAFPHYPTGKIPKKYRHKLMSIETIGKAKVIRVWVPPIASRGLAKRLMLYISFIVSSLFALPFIGHVDVVWAANPNIFSAYPALVYSFFKRCPLVLNVDDLWPEELYNLGMLNSSIFRKIAEYISRLTYAASAAITPISPAYVDVIVNKYEVDPQKVHVVPAGVDLDNFKAFATKHEKEGSIFKVLYIGALSPAYDFDYVLRAASLLSSESRIKFIIQGEGELGDGLKFKVEERGLQNVDVILKVVSRSRVAEILSSADVLLLPLRSLNYTGISSKLYEYQASGKPVICCSRGQPAEYVSGTGSGIVVTPGDDEGLAEAILYLYNRRDIAEGLGKVGREYVENNLSCKKIGLKMESVFKFSAHSRKSLMGLKDEIDVYDKAKVSVDTGEIEDYDDVVFLNVIRRREIDLIKSELQAVKPKRILDFGCGGGWLSKILASYNYEVVGMDVSCSLVNSAKRAAPTITFVVGDGMNLPFREGAFDAVVSIATLHHVDVKKGLKEVRRVSKNRGTLMLMEPNKLNPLSAIGRKLFPMETHTLGEEPFIPAQLRSYVELQGFKVKLVRCLFFFSFPLARMLKLLNFPPIPRFLVRIVDTVERMFEHLPVLSSLNSTIVVLAE